MPITPYIKRTEKRMKAFYNSLPEKERRRYAAIEAEKLGHGGVEYIADLFQIDGKTIRHGLSDIDDEQALTQESQRKKGGDEKVNLNSTRN